jgi:CRISPR-associated protein Cmr2
VSQPVLHFSLGPVQGFIAEARRTRDLWAGSYLLSYLSGVAMDSLIKNGAPIDFPDVTPDGLLKSIQDGEAVSETAKRIGTLPNRFSARAAGDTVDLAKAASNAVDAIHSRWVKIAEAVHGWLIDRLSSSGAMVWTSEMDKTWEQQIRSVRPGGGANGGFWGGFWETPWVVSPSVFDVDRRKTIRDFPASSWEAGPKCTICGWRNALSGGPGTRPHELWAALAKAAGGHHIRPSGERLCAPCAVKRFFPEVAGATLGWRVPATFPSTSGVAIARWQQQLLLRCARSPEVAEAAGKFAGMFSKVQDAQASEPLFDPLEDAADNLPGKPSWARDLARARGEVFDFDWYRGDGEDRVKPGDMAAVKKTLSALHKAAGEPGSFFAVLAADGDRMGDLIAANPKRRNEISKALRAFAQSVPHVVEAPKVCGRVIYAGGDDLLALCPASTCLEAASSLADSFHNAFATHAGGLVLGPPTLSVGIVCAPVRSALGAIVKRTHEVLEKEAKDRAGRNAWAVSVWKRGGETMLVTRNWPGRASSGGMDYVAGIREAARLLRSGEWPTRLAHKLQGILDRLGPIESGSPLGSRDGLRSLFWAQYLKTRERKIEPAEAERHANLLVDLAFGVAQTGADLAEVDLGPLFLAHFLDSESPRE